MGKHDLKSRIFCELRRAMIDGTQSGHPNYKFELKRAGKSIENLIFCEKTFHDYWSVAKRFAEFVWSTFGIDDTLRVTPEHIRRFMRHGIEECGWNKNTSKQIASALAKVGAVFDRRRMFSRAAAATLHRDWPRPEAPRVVTDELFWRAFEELTSRGSSEGRLLASRVAHCGPRLCEVTYKWRWFTPDGRFVVQGNTLLVRGKGGKWRTIQIPEDLARDLTEFYLKYGNVKLDDYDGHRTAWAEACRVVGAPVNTHARRHRYAQRSYVEKRLAGKDPAAAAASVSLDLGHGLRRPDITRGYLGDARRPANPTLESLIRQLDRIIVRSAGDNPVADSGSVPGRQEWMGTR